MTAMVMWRGKIGSLFLRELHLALGNLNASH